MEKDERNKISTLEWTNILNEINKIIVNTLDQRELITSLFNLISNTIPLDAFYIDILDPEVNDLFTIFMVDRINGELAEVTPQKNQASLTQRARAILSGEPVLILRKPNEVPPPTIRFGNKERHSSSLMFAPLKKKNEIIGIMSAQSYMNNAYNESHLSLLCLIANQVAFAIENLRLTEEIQKKADELSFRNVIIKKIFAASDINSVLDSIAIETREYFEVAYCSLFLIENESLVHYVTYSEKGFNHTSFAQKVGESLAGRVVSSGMPYFTSDLNKEPNFKPNEIESQFLYHTYLAVPILLYDKVLGILALYSNKERIFKKSEIDLLLAITSGSAVAIESIKQAQRFAQSELKFQTLLENANDIIFTLDANGRITYLGSQWSDFLGYPLKECMGKQLDDFIYPEDKEIFSQVLKTVLTENQKFSKVQIRFRHSNGSFSWYSINGNVLNNEEGVCIGILGICRDITSAIHLETQIRNTMKYYQNIFYYTPIAMFTINNTGQVTSANDAAMKLLFEGFDEKSVSTINSFQHPTLKLLGLKDALDSFSKQKSFFRENVHLSFNKERKDLILNIQVVPLFDVTTQFEEAVVMCEDITKRKRAQEQLFQTQKMESIGHIAGGIAHDFDNILSGVLGYNSLIKNLIDPSSEIYPYTEQIEKSAERAAFLTDQLLGFARGGKYTIECLDMNKTILETIDILKSSIKHKIRIKTNLEENLKKIEGDSSQIKQVITNLCLNASEAIPEDGDIIISTSNNEITEDDLGKFTKFPHLKNGEYIKIEVEDNGKGMDEEILKQCFEPFFSTKGFGRGLGLPATIGIIENHHGAIIIESQPEQGTKVKIFLPVISSRLTSEVALFDSQHKDETSEKDTRPVILVVDDDRCVRETFNDILQQIGYQTLIADSGENAVAIYRKNYEKIDLIILDILMPGMNGMETFFELRKINNKLKVLFCSGYDELTVFQETLEEGKFPFLHKPFNIERLKNEVEKLIGTKDKKRADKIIRSYSLRKNFS